MYGSNPQYNSHSICRKVKYVHRLMQIKERLDKIEHDISGRTTVVCTCQFVTSGLILPTCWAISRVVLPRQLDLDTSRPLKTSLGPPFQRCWASRVTAHIRFQHFTCVQDLI